MDYNFVTIDRFMELEKSGALLESGTYEGKDLVKSLLRLQSVISGILQIFLWNLCCDGAAASPFFNVSDSGLNDC